MQKTIRKPIQFSKIQTRFLNTSAIYSAYCGGRGAGKSFIGSYRAIRRMLRAKENTTGMVIAPTYGVLHDASFKMFMEHVYNFGLDVKVNNQHFSADFGGNRTILFRSAERPGRLRGKNLSWIWMDEAGEIEKEVFDIVIACLRENRRQGEIWATFTPKGRQHWTYETFGKCKKCEKDLGECGCTDRGDTELFTSSTSENLFLPPGWEDMIKKQYTSKFAIQELAGKFIDMNAGVFERQWFKLTKEPAKQVKRRARSWDKAGVEGGGCYTVGVLMSQTESGLYYVEHVVRGQLSALQRNELILQTAKIDREKYGNKTEIIVEQEPGSGGKESAEYTVRQLAGFKVIVERPSGDKAERAQPFAAQAEQGNVYLMEADWNHQYLDELTSFPEGKYADQVDATTQAFNNLAFGGKRKFFLY